MVVRRKQQHIVEGLKTKAACKIKSQRKEKCLSDVEKKKFSFFPFLSLRSRTIDKTSLALHVNRKFSYAKEKNLSNFEEKSISESISK